MDQLSPTLQQIANLGIREQRVDLLASDGSGVGVFLGDQGIPRDAPGRHTVLEVLQGGVDLGTGPALGLATAKAAMVTGDKFTQAGKGPLGNGLDALAPGPQLLHGDFIRGVAVQPGLVNGHADPLDGVTEHGGIAPERSQGVKFHLWVAHGRNRDALAVLVVGDAQQIAADDAAVTGAKALRHIVRKVHPDLHGHGGGAVIVHDLLRDVLQVKVRGLVHLRVIEGVFLELIEPGVVGPGAHGGAFLEDLELTNGVGQAALLRILAGVLRQPLLKTGGRRTLEPAGGRGGRKQSVFLRRHGAPP